MPAAAPSRARTLARLALPLLFLSVPSSADAQLLDRLKRAAEDLLADAVRCTVSDTACYEEAKARGEDVVLTDANGEVLVDEDGDPVTDPAKVPQTARTPGRLDPANVRIEPLATIDLGGLPPEMGIERAIQAWLAQQEIQPARFAISANGHAAGVQTEGSRYVVSHDGVTGPPFAEIGPVTLSEDGAHLAYVAVQGGQTQVMRDHEPVGASYSDVRLLRFSPDGSRLAFAANKGGTVVRGRGATGGTWHVVVDGAEGPPSDGVQALEFSATGVLAATTFQGDRGRPSSVTITIDGRDAVEAGGITDFRFSEDGAHFAYVMWEGDQRDGTYRSYVVRDGQRTERYGVRCLRLSPDGRDLSYQASVALNGEPPRIFVNGEALPPAVLGVGCEGAPPVAISPAGRKAWIEHVGGAAGGGMGPVRAIVDGTPGLEYEAIQGLRFVGERIFYIARQNRRAFLVLGESETAAPETGTGQDASRLAQELVLSPDGEHVAVHMPTPEGTTSLWADGEIVAENAYGATFASDGTLLYGRSLEANTSQIVVLGEREFGPFSFRPLQELTPSGDGGTFAALTAGSALGTGENVCYLVRGDEILTGPGHQCQRPLWSPDGAHVAYTTFISEGGGQFGQAAALDAAPTPTFDWIFFEEPGILRPNAVNTFRFADDGKLVFLAMDGAEIQRVTVTP